MKLSRRLLLLIGLAVIGVLFLNHINYAQAPSGDKAKEAVNAALEYLAKTQQGGEWPMSYAMPGKVVVSSFCGLAYLASGSTPAKGKYSNNIKNILVFVMNNINNDGLGGVKTSGGGNNNQTNWSLGIGGLFLAEVYQVTKAKDVKEKLESVCRKIMDNQESSGGWGHGPGGPNALNYVELNVVANWCLATLGLSKQLGIDVDNAKIDRGIKYIMDSCAGGGGVGYSTREGQKGDGCPGRTGATIFVFKILGKQNDNQLKKMVTFVETEMPKLFTRLGYAHGSPSMGLFGCAIGSYNSGKKELWEKFTKLFFEKIISHQNADGSFKAIMNEAEKNEDSICQAYPTGIMALVLQLPESGLLITDPRKTKAIDCDLKDKKALPVCVKCNGLLNGYKCSKCGENIKPVMRQQEWEGGVKYFVLEACRKCPKCNNGMVTLLPTGGELFSLAQMVSNGKCAFCSGEVKEEMMCVKTVYACPDHPEAIALSSGKCQICKKSLSLKETVYSKIITLFQCAKCGYGQETAGDCPKCKGALAKKEQCEMSSSFPHVDQKKWQELVK
jgi:hypothetical protein